MSNFDNRWVEIQPTTNPEAATRHLIQALKALTTKLEAGLQAGKRIRFAEPTDSRIEVDADSVQLAEAAADLEPEVQKGNPKLLPHQAYAEALRRVRANRR